MMATDRAPNESKDWSRQRAGMLIWWVLPILIGLAASVMRLALSEAALVWAVAFAWMGTGCLLNARRCARLHCFFSGPVFWLGAIAAGLVGTGVISGPHALNNVISVTAVLALVSFAPEWVWGKYARRQ